MSKDKKSKKYMPQISYHKKEHKNIDVKYPEHGQDNPDLEQLILPEPTSTQAVSGPTCLQESEAPICPKSYAGGSSTFGYFYEINDSILDLTIAGGENIPFSNNGPLNDITHIAGSDTISINTAGDYEIQYSVNITNGIDTEIALAVGQGPSPDVASSTRVSVLTGVGIVSGQAILTLAAGDIINLRNSSVYEIETITLAHGPSIGAQMTIKRLN